MLDIFEISPINENDVQECEKCIADLVFMVEYEKRHLLARLCSLKFWNHPEIKEFRKVDYPEIKH